MPGSRARHPRPRPARRRRADPCLRSRPHLSVQRQPRGANRTGRSRCARPIISTGWRRGSRAALSVPTAAGPLYEVDTRLRPSGADGLLAVSLDSFAALSARAGLDLRAYGADPGAAGLRLGGGRGGARRDRRRRAADRRAIPPRSPPTRRGCAPRSPATSRRAGRSTSSSAPGGLVDLEFAVHMLQLAHRVGLDPRLGDGGRGAGRGRAGAARDRRRASACSPGCWSPCGWSRPIRPSRRRPRGALVARACGHGRLGGTACGARRGAAKHMR